MNTRNYKKQAQLLLSVLPMVAKENCFALHGGTAINLFLNNMPRLSVDMNKMFTIQPFDDELKKGFIFYLVSSNRPIVEMLFPHLQDQHLVFEKQFMGMTYEPFSYADFENTRELLIQKIQTVLSTNDKKFLLSIENGTPEWGIYDFSAFPAVQWKLVNVRKFKTQNPLRYKHLYSELEAKLAK